MATKGKAVDAILKQMQHWRYGSLLGQLIRFGIAGGISTVIYSGVYLPLAWYVFGDARAVLAVPFAFAAAVTAGYFLHSAWSFRGHGTRTTGHAQKLRFVAVQAFGLLLHAAFTWVLTGLLHQPAWVPLVPGIFLVPLVTFVLNRQWVFA